MKKKMDIIDQKRLELNTYVAQYNSAISLITGTIDSLGSISQNMADKIGEIEELVAATLVRMSNEVNGLMLFIFKLDLANAVLGKLIGRNYQSFGDMDEMDYSALEEIGNIIICSYVNAFTQLVGVEIDLSVPSSTINMLGGILTVPIAEYGYETDKLMYINAEFIMDGEKLTDGLLMLPDIASLNRILEKLGIS